MASNSPSRLTQLVLGATALTATTLGAYKLVTQGDANIQGAVQVEQVRFVNDPVALSGTGADGTQITFSKNGNANLTATGGLAAYNTLTWGNPDSFTGALLSFCIDVKTAASPTTIVDVGVVKDGGTGTATTLFDSLTLTRGVHCADVSDTAEVLVGPTERIKAGSLTGTGQGLDAEMFVEYREARL